MIHVTLDYLAAEEAKSVIFHRMVRDRKNILLRRANRAFEDAINAAFERALLPGHQSELSELSEPKATAP
jgi:hypothetical protein